jgi:outer membrane protein OmpA-like peptidoglycan-associated protein
MYWSKIRTVRKENLMIKYSATFLLVIALFITGLGCGMSKKKKGVAIGAASGGVLGGVIGKKAGSTVIGTIVGAAIGGAAGAYIGDYMDDQAEEMAKEIEGANIERVEEGINIDFDSGLLFDVNQSGLKPESKETLAKFAEIVNKYGDTVILIEGHTDSTGSDGHNLELSRRRAQSVANYLASLQVAPTRFTIMGYGESQPIASNEAEEGRAANRRVEFAIVANDKLKQVAKSKTE